MTAVYPPFYKEKRAAVEGLCTGSARSLVSATYVRKLFTTLILPTISISGNVWRGASEIVRIYRYTSAAGLSFLDTIKSENSNFCAVIAWKPTSNTIVRYKLWEGVGEILYVPLYTGQTTGAEFQIEIWNTPDTELIGGGDTFTLSQMALPTDFCEGDSSYSLDLGGTICEDITFDLSDFNPAAGDYYQIVDTGGCLVAVLVKATSAGNYFTLQCVNDLTWHKFYVYRDVYGVVTYGIDQTNSAAGTKEYVPFIIDGVTRKLNLVLDPFGIYNINLNETVVDPLGAVSYLLTDPNTGFNHAVIGTSELGLSFGQTDL
jgi:hypothetical protein